MKVVATSAGSGVGLPLLGILRLGAILARVNWSHMAAGSGVTVNLLNKADSTRIVHETSKSNHHASINSINPDLHAVCGSLSSGFSRGHQ